MIAQFTVIALGLIGLGINIALHGKKKKKRKYNGWIHFIAMIFMWTILYYGGFWEGII